MRDFLGLVTGGVARASLDSECFREQATGYFLASLLDAGDGRNFFGVEGFSGRIPRVVLLRESQSNSESIREQAAGLMDLNDVVVREGSKVTGIGRAGERGSLVGGLDRDGVVWMLLRRYATRGMWVRSPRVENPRLGIWPR
jgi:hypothetical protein